MVLHLESEAEPAPSEPASSTDAEVQRRMDPFRNPSHVRLEVDYGELDLDSSFESKLELCELFSELGEIEVDSLKKALVNHLWYEENQFQLFKRNFQLSIYVSSFTRMASSGIRHVDFRMPELASN